MDRNSMEKVKFALISIIFDALTLLTALAFILFLPLHYYKWAVGFFLMAEFFAILSALFEKGNPDRDVLSKTAIVIAPLLFVLVLVFTGYILRGYGHD